MSERRPRVVVLGAGGMLGHKLFQRLSHAPVDLLGTLRGRRSAPPYAAVPFLQDAARVEEEVDAADWEGLHGRLRAWRPDVVVNCVGVIKQREAAKAVIPSLTINSLLPHRLAEALASWNGRLIHLSTDCVFSGRRGHYTEDDVSDAEDLYGRTKYLGEVGVSNAVTLRTSMIGRELAHHQSLLDWLLRQHGTIRGFTRAIYAGLTTLELAAVIERVILTHPALSGVYQVASQPIAKHDLLRLLAASLALDVEVVPDDSFVCDRSLEGGRFETATGYRCPDWPTLVAALAADPTPYKEWVNF